MTEFDHAVVIGGSMAGQLAAAVLAQHVARVTILDRDEFPDDAMPRKGLPQARHVHALQVSGHRTLEDLLPGITANVAARGAHLLDWTRDIAVHSLAGWHRRHTSGLQSHFMSRDLLDLAIRQYVRANAKVRTLSIHEVTALTGDTTTVRGVRYRARGEANGGEQTLPAGLVVDASGRSSRAPAWLRELGCDEPREITVDSFLGYTTRMYRPPRGFDPGWKGMIVRSPQSINRAGGISPIEDDRWLVTLAGFAKDYPPQDEQGFLAFAASVGVPELTEALHLATPLTAAVGYRRTTNRWREYHKMRRWPEGFIGLGDAVCAFNPYYGQGMSVVALSARALRDQLTEGGRTVGFASRFQRRLGRLLQTPWFMATTEECRYPETEGAVRTWGTAFNLWYTDRVIARAAHDPIVQQELVSVAHLVRPFRALVRPRVLLPALLSARAVKANPPPGTMERATTDS